MHSSSASGTVGRRIGLAARDGPCLLGTLNETLSHLAHRLVLADQMNRAFLER